MKLRFLNAILILLLSFTLCCGNSFEGIPRKTCSRELTRRLSRVCSNGFNTMQRYISLGSQPRRVRRQVVDECCKQACTDATIKLYCMGPQEQPSPSGTTSHAISTLQKEVVTPPPVVIHPRLRYQNIRIGTVAPEFNRIAVTAPLYRASFYKSFN